MLGRRWLFVVVVNLTRVAAVEGEQVVEAYVARHQISTAEVIGRIERDPCSQRFISADFWGRGLGNSVNTPLNALGLGIALNRTLLLSVDKQYEAGFWKYLGAVPWPRKDAVLRAFQRAGGCRRCGCQEEEKIHDFFPMNQRCLKENRCGGGVRWLLCDAANQKTPFIHVRGAVTWLAPLLPQFHDLFPHGTNAWGLLFNALVDRKDLSPLSPVLDRFEKIYDLGVHIRHRQFQPIDQIQIHAAKCVAHAVESLETTPIRVYLATELPTEIPRLIAAMESATSKKLRIDYLNASTVPERDTLRRIARTNARAVRRDWGDYAFERWLSVADFYLLASSRVLVGTLSSTFSELAAASVVLDTRSYLYDPIFHISGPHRSQPQKRKWPSDDEYLSDYGDHFRCIRSDPYWPLPQYVRLRPAHAANWIRQRGCDLLVSPRK